jgi:hypothetical protein
MTELSLIIGSGKSESLRITPLRRTHPKCVDYWDGNWVDSSIEVSVGAFTGKYTACLRTDEFKMFRLGIDPLYESWKGTASFASMEGWVDIQVAGDGLGHFQARCVLMDAAGVGNTLKFDLHFDQTELLILLKSLMRIEESFPVIGQLPA